MFSLFKKQPKAQIKTIFISYDIGCENCMKSDGARHQYLVHNATIEEYKKKAIHELVQTIQKWRKEDNRNCQFCGSFNVEVFNIKID